MKLFEGNASTSAEEAKDTVLYGWRDEKNSWKSMNKSVGGKRRKCC